jgi:UDP-glucose 4-epimerase
LAKGHCCGINKLEKNGLHIYNLGTGKGVTVLELVTTFINVNNLQNFNYEFAEKRDGDIAVTYANADKVFYELGWQTELNIEDICKTL